MSNVTKTQLELLKQNTPVKNTEIDTRPSAEVLTKEAIGNADTKVIKAEDIMGDTESKKTDSTKDNKPKEDDKGGNVEKKSNAGRKATRSETMKKFSFKVPKELSDLVKASLLRKGKKIQPVLTKMVEEWISNPTELNIDSAYLDVPARSMKSTGFYLEQETINEFGAVTTEQGTSMNLVIMHFHNEIVRGNY